MQQDLVTPVPVKIAVAQLRGFVADHQAKIVAVDGNRVRLEIDHKPANPLRRLTDRSAAFSIDICLEEERLQKDRSETSPSSGGQITRTRISIAVSPRRNRDRRRHDVATRAREVVTSFRAYLMASEEESVSSVGALTRAKRILAPWLNRP